MQWWGFNCVSGNEETVRTESYMKLAAPLKHWFNIVELSNLFCLVGTEWACVNGEGDHGVMWNGGDLVYGSGGAGVCGQTIEDGCNSLLMPVCGSVGDG